MRLQKRGEQEAGELRVLDSKRSQNINITLTKLPPPRAIKTAIIKFDSSILTKEGIEKVMAMLPTEKEKEAIQEKQAEFPDRPLGGYRQPVDRWLYAIIA